MLLSKTNGTHNIKSQDFIWMASYSDGTYLSEFDLQTGMKDVNGFYKIDKNKLIEFGLIGSGSKAYFSTLNGDFIVNGHAFNFEYLEGNKLYRLNGHKDMSVGMYNDIISYKDAVSDANFFSKVPQGKNGEMPSTILQYNVGFKKTFIVEGVKFNFQLICTIPLNEPSYFQVKITSDKEMTGKLCIRRNNNVVDLVTAPLKKGVSGQINWTMR